VFTLKLMFLAVLAIILILAIAPLPDPTGSDKAYHMLAFAVLAGMGWFAFPRLSTLQLAVALSAIGAIIEFLQAIPFVQGNPQFNDWLADNLGLALMLAVLWGAQQVIEGLWPRAGHKPPPHS
jgi:hypothetical protein